MNKNWHLCIPPLLTLLDDPTTVIRVRGLHILQDLLCRIPPKVLQQAGLGEVFEDAVMPTLLFLPTITPVEESLNLLSSAYLALFSLGYVRYQSKVGRGNELKFLDRVMRQGVLQGFIHSGDNVRIAELLVNEVTTIFSNMGIHAVKYLKVSYKMNSYSHWFLITDIGRYTNIIGDSHRPFWSVASQPSSGCSQSGTGDYSQLLAANDRTYPSH